MRRDLGGHLDAPRLGPAQQFHRAGGRHVADVQPGPDVPGEQHIAGDDRLLGGGRPAGEAEPRGAVALVHLGALGQPRLLRVLGDDTVEGLDVLEGPAHQGRLHATHLPSSVKTLTRAAESAIAPSSARREPWRPDGDRPHRRTTSTRPASRPSRQTCSTTPAVSATGSVLAIACTAVKPPSAAARVPVSTVSASSRPGSRRWVCRSTSRQGDHTGRVDHLGAGRTAIGSPIASMRRPATRMLAGVAAERSRAP